MKKRGMSTVITTLILIVLVLTAVAIIWAVISNMISEGTEDVGLGAFTISLDIEKITLKENTIDVQVKRNQGKGELTSIKFLVSDRENTYAFDQEANLQELETETFTLNHTGLVKEVSIAPIVGTEGGETIGKTQDTLVYNSGNEFRKISGLVSWWRFENNPNDEQGLNDGSIQNAIFTEGKFGQALYFDGNDDYLIVTPPQGIPKMDNSTTYSAWINLKSDFSAHSYSVILGWPWADETALTLSNTQQIEFNMYDSLGTQISFTHTETINKNQWYHVVTTYEGNGNIINIYVNGNRQEFTSTNPPRDATWQRIMMGADDLTFYFLDIIIDEPMVFNRALTPDEVRVLYNFNPEE